ncbi:hypothetical protein [Zavarzinia sp. CC-PAN008]|uniref:hypothetical protein n=1 Tax=Zavarzinia sp. CC-PAN008 TaxID=3243332 RepID=UPI003F74846E
MTAGVARRCVALLPMAATLVLCLAGPALAQQSPASADASDAPCFEPNERSLGEYHVISQDLRRVLLQGTDRLERYGGLPPDDVALKTTSVDKDVLVFIYVRRPHGGRTPLCYREQATLPLKRYLELVAAAASGGAP